MNIVQKFFRFIGLSNINTLSRVFPNKYVNLLDIGARDGLVWPWSQIDRKTLKLTLVEPDRKEADKLMKKYSASVLQHALWSRECSVSLYMNQSPGTSSVFKPNMKILENFHDSHRFNSEKALHLHARTIDSLSTEGLITEMDFVKIDTQGGELEILKGGERFLRDNIIGLEIEVEFVEMYEGQPLFSEIDNFIRKNLGLELWDLRKTYWHHKKYSQKQPIKGKIIFGDVLYFRSIESIDEWLSGKDQKYASRKISALIMSAFAYGYLDYVAHLIDSDLVKKHLSSDLRNSIQKELNSISRGFYPFKYGNRFLYKFFNILTYCFRPTYNGWANSEPHLGNRKKSIFWF